VSGVSATSHAVQNSGGGRKMGGGPAERHVEERRGAVRMVHGARGGAHPGATALTRVTRDRGGGVWLGRKKGEGSH
jgi:hypothetical protein